MKILLTVWYREWRGREPQVLQPEVLSLDDEKILFGLVVSIGNGDYDEVCIETDSIDTKECIEGLLRGTGRAKWIMPSSAVEQCRLYRSGYLTYLQGGSSYFFINPVPRPELFEKGYLKEYVAEFKQA
jgi:hypothetical protein